MPATPAALRPHLRTLLVFALVFAVLQAAWAGARGTAAERLVIDGATVHTAAALIKLLTPQAGAQGVGSAIRAPGGGINILHGCEGTEVLFLLAAAVLAHRATSRQRAVGLAAGTALVFLLNQARVLALFYAYRSDRELFALLHAHAAPLLLVAATLAGFLAWVAWCRRRAPAAGR